MQRLATRILIALSVCALVLIALSFAPWISFESTIATEGGERSQIDISGTGISRLRDLETIEPSDIDDEVGWCSCRASFGDGWFVALLGIGLLGASGLALWRGPTNRGAVFGVVVALGAVGLTGWNAFGEWRGLAVTGSALTLEEVEGTPTVWLWLLLSAGMVAAVLGTVLWVIVPDDDEGYDEYEGGDDEQPAEGLSEWA